MDTYRKPENDSCEGDDRPTISIGIFKAGCDTAECLSFEKAACDEMALGVEKLVERIFEGACRVVGDDSRAPVEDGMAQVIGIIGRVTHDELSR